MKDILAQMAARTANIAKEAAQFPVKGSWFEDGGGGGHSSEVSEMINSLVAYAKTIDKADQPLKMLQLLIPDASVSIGSQAGRTGSGMPI